MLLSLRHYLSQALAGPSPERWHPLLAVCYLTYDCGLRCPFCSDGAGKPYPALDSPVLPGPQVLALLKTVRRYSDYVVLTGGEPLGHPDFDLVMEGIGPLGFDGVILTTRGRDLEGHLDAVAGAVRYLVVSIDTLDRDKADRWLGAGPGTLERILANVSAAAAWPGRRFELIVSSVATPDNIEDLHAVYDFCRERGLRFALCPQLQGVKAHPALAGHEGYRLLYDRLIADKRAGASIQGSVPYLEHMRDLAKFDCRPSAVLAVSPSGDVFYPCLERGTTAGNLLEIPDLDRLRREGLRRHGPEPACDNRCQSACALGLSLLLERPWSIAGEAWLMLKAACAKVSSGRPA